MQKTAAWDQSFPRPHHRPCEGGSSTRPDRAQLGAVAGDNNN